MTTSADFLRELERVADSDGLYSGQFVKEALAAERHATVERLKDAIYKLTFALPNEKPIEHAGRIIDGLAAILDEEATS